MSGGLLVPCASCDRQNRLRPEMLGRPGRCGACGAELTQPGAPYAADVPEDLAALVAASRIPVLVDFWAPWCGPCRSMEPEIARLAAKQRGRLLVLKVNTDVDASTGTLYRITAVPTLVLFSGGQELTRRAGAMTAARIEAWIDEALGVRG